MQKFEEVVTRVAKAAVAADDLAAALQALGPRAKVPVDHIGRVDRAMMADQLVRHLKTLSVQQATVLERELLRELDATPGRFSSKLDGAVSLVELRTHLKQSLTGLGLDWEKLTRAQSLVAGVARWLQSIGGASMRVMSTHTSVDFVLTAEDRRLTPDEVRQSPLVQMLSAQTAHFQVHKEEATVEITFSILRAV